MFYEASQTRRPCWPKFQHVWSREPEDLRRIYKAWQHLCGKSRVLCLDDGSLRPCVAEYFFDHSPHW